MPLVPCPSCGLPRTAADAGAAPCPACGWRVGDPVAVDEPEVVPASEPTPPPVPEAEPHPRRNRWLAGAGVAIASAVLVAMLAWPGDPPPDPTAGLDTRPPQEVAVVPPGPEPSLPVAPPPREADPDDPVVIPVPVPIPAAGAAGVAVIRVDRPDDDYHFPRLDGPNRVRLVGRVKKLLVDGVEGGATLDASELTATGVTVYGGVTGGSTLLVKCAGGYVTVRGKVDGGSRLTIDGGGAVSFNAPGGKKEGAMIAGGSRVTIRGKSVTLSAPVTGPGTVVEITFAPAGVLKFAALEDGARIVYLQEHRADPPPKVTPGKVSGGAELVAVPVD